VATFRIAALPINHLQPVLVRVAEVRLGTVEDDLRRLEQAGRIKDNRIKQLEQSMQTRQENLDAVAKVLSLNPGVADVEAALHRRTAQRQPQNESE